MDTGNRLCKLSVDERGIVDVAIRQGNNSWKASVGKVAGFKRSK